MNKPCNLDIVISVSGFKPFTEVPVKGLKTLLQSIVNEGCDIVLDGKDLKLHFKTTTRNIIEFQNVSPSILLFMSTVFNNVINDKDCVYYHVDPTSFEVVVDCESSQLSEFVITPIQNEILKFNIYSAMFMENYNVQKELKNINKNYNGLINELTAAINVLSSRVFGKALINKPKPNPEIKPTHSINATKH